MDEQTYRLAVELRDRLQAELAENETFRAFQHVDAIVAMWGKHHNAATSSTPARPAAPKANPTPPKRVASVGVKGHFQGSQAYNIANGAQEFLNQKGSRAPAGEIYKYLVSKGVHIGGKAPLKTTASYLSHSPNFDNVLGEGYGLVEWSGSSPVGTEAPDSSELSGAPRSNGALNL